MIGIGIATATAGIIVGAVSQTGVGSALADVVEVLSGGNILAILFLTAILSLILGMGLPTTANYIVVSALLAPVIVTLGQQNGLIVPLIAVHLFVFYFGIMADVTPPVGLASFAAAAVSGRRSDQDRRGGVLLLAAHRRAAVPVHLQHRTAADQRGLGPRHLRLHHRHRRHAALRGGDAGMVPRHATGSTKPIALLLVAFTLFRPGFWMDMVLPPFHEVDPRPRSQPRRRTTPPGDDLRLRVDRRRTTSAIRSNSSPCCRSARAQTGAEKLAECRAQYFRQEDGTMIIDNVDLRQPRGRGRARLGSGGVRVLRPVAAVQVLDVHPGAGAAGPGGVPAAGTQRKGLAPQGHGLIRVVCLALSNQRYAARAAAILRHGRVP